MLAAVISIAVGEGGSDTPPNEGFNETQRLFAGVEQEGALLGDPGAPVLVTVHNDVNCRSCADYQVAEIDPLVEPYARAGLARFEFSHFSLGPQPITLGALAATAGGEQGRQWQYIDLLMRNLDSAGGEADDQFLREVAETVPELDLERWEADRASDEVGEVVEADADVAVERRLPPEVVVIVTGPDGEKRLEDSPARAEIEAAIEAVGGERAGRS